MIAVIIVNYNNYVVYYMIDNMDYGDMDYDDMNYNLDSTDVNNYNFLLEYYNLYLS